MKHYSFPAALPSFTISSEALLGCGVAAGAAAAAITALVRSLDETFSHFATLRVRIRAADGLVQEDERSPFFGDERTH